MSYQMSKSFSPSRTILLSLGLALGVGTFLLSLEAARLKFIPLIDLFFTATSSLCVTGLLTVPLESFTLFGKTVIMLLMQVGGLGLITLTLFVVSLFVDLGLSTQIMAGETLDLDSWRDTGRILLFIILLSISIELIGAGVIFYTLRNFYPLHKAIFYSLFQSISAFCNAGIDIITPSLKAHIGNYSMILSLSFLMIIGGLGFITLKELFTKLNPFNTSVKKILFSLQTRIILAYSGFLLIANTCIFWLLERNYTLSHLPLPEQILNSFFMSASCRSAGFLTISANNLQKASLLSFMINSFIGSAPGSTGSGIKITTAAIFIATINAAIQGKSAVTVRGRTIMKDQIYKALAIVSLGILWITLVTFCLLITEKSWHFLDILLETVGAFSTLGVSVGITPYLSLLGKLLIIATMFIGRIGSLTLMIALRKKADKNEFSYPEERVMIS